VSVSLRLERRDDVVVAQMAHGKANALDLEFCATIVSTLDALAASSARAVVLTGTGSIFSAGVDLLRLCDDGPDYRSRFVPALSELMDALFSFPRPLVAAVNGHAVAGGCLIACTADHRIMTRGSGRIGVPELMVGIPFPTKALEVLRFVVPSQYLQAVVYRGAAYTPDEALAIGLIDEVAEPAALVNAAVAAAARMAALPPDVFALTKRQLRAPALAFMQAGAARDEEIATIWTDPAAIDRVRDYVARTFKRRVQ
jgi:enoyl-CoA hydratase